MLEIGRVLKGALGSYKITRQLYKAVWVAVNEQVNQNVIIKHVEHDVGPRERDILRRFQRRAPTLRPLLEELDLESESKWPALVLRWLEDDTLNTSSGRKYGLTRPEVKLVGRSILSALEVLHEDGYVHTDIKPNNILVNYDLFGNHVAEVQVADCGNTLHETSKHARDGLKVGAAIFRSPEAMMELPWNTSTDIWSFGATLISMIYGGNFHLFSPKVSIKDEAYELYVLMRQNEFFGPFPRTYEEIADPDTLETLAWIMEATLDSRKPFHLVTKREVSDEDKRFLLKIMKLDPRDRPTAKELLADEWFS